jgi:O-antigen/teichoic acid export membrane protein
MKISEIKSMLQHKIFRESSYVVLAQLVTIGIAFITSIILARNLGLEGFGQYNLLLVYIALLQIVGLPGMNVVISKGIMKAYDPIFNIALQRSFLFSGLCSLFIALAALMLFFFDMISQETLIILLIIACFAVLAGIDKYDSLLQAKKAFYLSRKIAIINAFLTLLVVGSLAYYTKSFIVAIVAYFFVRLVIILIGLKVAYRLVIPMKNDNKKQQLLLEESKKYSLLSLFNIGVGQLDKLIIGLLDSKLLAIYTVGSFFPRKIKDNVKVLLSVPVVHMGSMSKEKNWHLVTKHGAKLFIFGIFLTAMIWILVPWFIPFVYGSEYQDAVWIAQILSLSLSFIFVGLVVLSFDIYQNRGELYRRQYFIRQTVYMLLIAFAIPYYGLVGLVFSVIMIEIVFSVLAILFTSRKYVMSNGS